MGSREPTQGSGAGNQNVPPLVNELRKAKLNAVKTLGEVCIAAGIPVETQVLAAKTLLEFNLETIRRQST